MYSYDLYALNTLTWLKLKKLRQNMLTNCILLSVSNSYLCITASVSVQSSITCASAVPLPAKFAKVHNDNSLC